MNNAERELARRALAGVPGFAPEDLDAAEFKRLPGLNNLVFRVDAPAGRFCLRIPGTATAGLVERGLEEFNARSAAEAGVAPQVLYFGSDGVMLTPFIADALPLLPPRLKLPGAIGRLAAALIRLHQNATAFPNEFGVFSVMRSYIGILRQAGPDPSHNLDDLLAQGTRLEAALSAQPIRSRPCHCDPTSANLLDTGDRVWMVDWEYSAMNDPLWDLAYFSADAGLEPDLERMLLHAYLQRPARPAEISRVILWKAVCELLSGLWALVQHGRANPAADFAGAAQASFRRCRALIGAADFPEHLETVQRG